MKMEGGDWECQKEKQVGEKAGNARAGAAWEGAVDAIVWHVVSGPVSFDPSLSPLPTTPGADSFLSLSLLHHCSVAS